MILGHEMAGQVAEVGNNVRQIHQGDRVTIDSVLGCGHCLDCLKGRTQFCATGSEYGISRDGGCQDYLTVPERNLHGIPESMSFEEAVLLDVEVWSALKKSAVHNGEQVLILGAGPIGLIACQMARALGAGRIVLSDVLHTRLTTARELQVADEYIESVEDVSPAEARYDLVVDCAGTAGSAVAVLTAAPMGGRVLLFGVHEYPISTFDINLIVLKDLVVFGAMSDRIGWEEVIDLVGSGALNIKSLITHRFSLENGALGYDAMRRRQQGLIKAVLLL
jgi:L-iditol 2-dehydrogenase